MWFSFVKNYHSLQRYLNMTDKSSTAKSSEALKENSLEDFVDDIIDLQENIESVKQQISPVKERIENTTAQIESLQQEVTPLKEETAKNGTQIESFQQELASLKQEISAAKSSSGVNLKYILITLVWPIGIALATLFVLSKIYNISNAKY
jgi:chromosome segregation ATPase